MRTLRPRTQNVRHRTAEKRDDLITRPRTLWAQTHISFARSEEPPVEGDTHDLAGKAARGGGIFSQEKLHILTCRPFRKVSIRQTCNPFCIKNNPLASFII